jgi:hypothetical protein
LTEENFNGYTSPEMGDTEFQINLIVTDRKKLSEEPEGDTDLDHSPKIEGTINNLPVDCLLDSGSEISLICQEFFTKDSKGVLTSLKEGNFHLRGPFVNSNLFIAERMSPLIMTFAQCH